MIRLTGGVFKGRKLPTINKDATIRPTQSIVRETLFNWLHNDLKKFRCLDLFAGSGVLAWEALSRGAEYLVLVEKSAGASTALRRQADMLAVTDITTVFCQDAMIWLKKASKKSAGKRTELYDLIFLDPPYSENLLSPVLTILSQKTVLNPDGMIYYESKQPIVLSEQQDRVFYSYKSSRRGKTYFGLLKHREDINSQ